MKKLPVALRPPDEGFEAIVGLIRDGILIRGFLEQNILTLNNLAGSRFGFLTGQILYVDGGFTSMRF